MPQNDVLAHPNLKAFLSHVGINSMYEVNPTSISLWLSICERDPKDHCVNGCMLCAPFIIEYFGSLVQIILT